MKIKKFHKKYINKVIIYILLFVGTMFFASNIEAAYFNYDLLETIPFIGNANNPSPGLGGLVLGLYKLLMAVTVIASLLMISVGGFYYMASAGNAATASSAKKIITDSLLGLLIAVSSYLMLYVINPDLVTGGTTTIFSSQIEADQSASPSIPLEPKHSVCKGCEQSLIQAGTTMEEVCPTYNDVCS